MIRNQALEGFSFPVLGAVFAAVSQLQKAPELERGGLFAAFPKANSFLQTDDAVREAVAERCPGPSCSWKCSCHPRSLLVLRFLRIGCSGAFNHHFPVKLEGLVAVKYRRFVLNAV